MWDGMLALFLNPRRLFLFLRDIIIGSGVLTDLGVPRGIAFELPAGAGGAILASRSARRFLRRRSLRIWVCGFPNPGGTASGTCL